MLNQFSHTFAVRTYSEQFRKKNTHVQNTRISIRQFFILWRTNVFVLAWVISHWRWSHCYINLQNCVSLFFSLRLRLHRYESAKIKPALTATHTKWTHQLETLGFIELKNKAETKWTENKNIKKHVISVMLQNWHFDIHLWIMRLVRGSRNYMGSNGGKKIDGEWSEIESLKYWKIAQIRSEVQKNVLKLANSAVVSTISGRNLRDFGKFPIF